MENNITVVNIPNEAQCTDELRGAIVKTFQAGERVAKQFNSLGNMLHLAGWKWTDTYSPTSKNSTATETQYNWMKESLVLSFPAAAQRALAAPNKKGLTPTAQALREEYQKKIGAYQGNIRALLKRRETTGDNGAANAPRHFTEIVDETVGKWEKRIDDDATILALLDDQQHAAFLAACKTIHSVVRAMNKKRS